MANNKNIIKGKQRIHTRSFGSGWTGNVLKSLGYSAQDVIAEMMPNVKGTIESTQEAKEELKDAFDTGLEKSKELAERGKTKLKDMRDKDLKELIEDIKSGKIYNKDRGGYDFGDFGFDDFGDFDEDFDSGFEDTDSPSKSVDVNIDASDNSPIVEAQVATANTMANSAETIVKENRANSASVAAMIAKMSSSTNAGLQLIHSEVAKITETVPKTISEQFSISAKFYEESIGYQKKISDNLEEIKALYTSSQKLTSSRKPEGKNSRHLMDISGLDLGSYKDLVKSNAISQVKDNGTISLLLSMVESAKTLRMNGGDSKSLGQKAINKLVKGLIGHATGSGIEKLDDFIGSMFLPIAMKIGKWRDDWGSPFKQLIGNIFGVKAKVDTSIDKEKYEKGAVAFDGKVHRAITDVIPTYLRMITSAVTGKEEIAFDYEKGVYNTVSNIRKDFDKNVKNAATSAYISETIDFGNAVDKMEKINREQKKELKNTFETFLEKMVRSNKFISPRETDLGDEIAKLLGKTSDDPEVRIIRDYFEGLYDSGKVTELNQIFSQKVVDARRNVQSYYDKMTADATVNNSGLMNNGLDKDGKNYIKNVSNTGVGLGVDKYGKSSTSYLRDILSILATGIKVVSVGSYDGDPDSIVSYSNKVLKSLELDVTNHRTKQNRLNADGKSSTPIDKIDYNSNDVQVAIAKALEETDDEDLIDRLANKYNDTSTDKGKNVINRVAAAIQGKRKVVRGKFDDAVNTVNRKTFDVIYGKRKPNVNASDGMGSENSTSGPTDIPPNPTIPPHNIPPSGGSPKSDNPQETDDSAPVVISPASPSVMRQLEGNVQEFGDSLKTDVIDKLHTALFSKEEGHEGLITKIEETELGKRGSNDKTEEAVAVAKDAAVAAIQGVVAGEIDPETGEYKNGLASGAANKFGKFKVDLKQWTHDLVYGDGKEDKGILGNIREFVGVTDDGKLDVSGKVNSALGTFKNHFINRSHEWTDMIFGESEEGEEHKLDVFLGDMKDKKGVIGAASVVGVLGSFFLPGGPIGGALIGAGLGMVSQSTQLKDFLFGKKDDNGDRTGGLITKDFQNFFKSHSKGIKFGVGAGVLSSIGLIPSMFVPGGPIGGALIGAGLSVVTKTKAFSNLLYGKDGTKEDPTGGITKLIKKHYSKDKDIKTSFMDAGIGAGVGLIGSFFLPGGPILGALIGAATNIIANTDKFKNFFFGEKDYDGKRKGGIFGNFKDSISEKMTSTQNRFTSWIHKIEDREDEISEEARAVSPDDNKKTHKKEDHQPNTEIHEEEKIVDDETVIDTEAKIVEESNEILKEQLDATKDNHAETKTLLEKILDKISYAKDAIKNKVGSKKSKSSDSGGDNDNMDDGGSEEDQKPHVLSFGRKLMGTTPIERIDTNVDRIVTALDRRLLVSDINTRRIYKLLRKRFKKGDDEEDSDEDDLDDISFFDRVKRGARGGLSKLRRLKDKISIKRLLGNIIGGVFGFGKDVWAKFKKVGASIKNTILSIPKKIFGVIKEVGPAVKKALVGVLKWGKNFVVGAVHAFGSAIKFAGTALGNILVGMAKGIGHLLAGIGVLGGEAIKLLAKGGAKFIEGTAKIAVGVGRWGVNLVKGLLPGHKKNNVQRIIVDGGHIDYVTLVKKVADDDSVLETIGNHAAQIIQFPGSTDPSAANGTVAAFGGGSLASNLKGKFSSFKESAKQKKDSFVNKVKNTASSIRDKFKREDADKEQQTWKNKILSLMTRNTETGERHHSVWNSIFSKKGLITAGLIIAAPIILKAMKGILGFFKSDTWVAIKGILSDIVNIFKDGGGLAGILNNAVDNIKDHLDLLGITDSKKEKIDENGDVVKDKLGNTVYLNEDLSGISSASEYFLPTETRVDSEGKFYQEKEWNHKTESRLNLVSSAAHYIAHKTVPKAKAAVETAKKLVNSKTGQAAIKGTKGVAKKALSGAKALGTKALGSDKVKTVLKYGKMFIDFMSDKFLTVLKKFGCEGKAGTLTKLLKGVTDKILNAKVISKYVGKFAKPLAKLAGAAASLMASDVFWATTGAVSGFANAASLFEVNEEDVDLKMRTIAAAIKGLCNTSWGSFVDILNDICYDITGVTFLGQIATLVYKLLSDEDDNAKIDAAKEKFNQEYRDYVTETYDAYVNAQLEAGKSEEEILTQEEFVSEGYAKSRADFNTEKNPSLGKRMYDGVTKATKAMAKTLAPAKKIAGAMIEWHLPHKEIVYMDSKGCYYKESSSGAYNYCSPLGIVLRAEVPEEDVKSLIESGQLTESKKWVLPDKVEKLAEIGSMAFEAYESARNLAKDTLNKVKEFGLNSISYWAKNIEEYGVFGAVWNAFKKEKKKAWFDVKGGYYILNENGSYDYYNAVGSLVTSNIAKDEVEDMITQGLLTEGEVEEDNDVQSALKDIRDKAKDVWKSAKDIGSNIFGKVKSWFNFQNPLSSEDDVSTGGNGGKGGEENRVASSSGELNGFKYYSQNDPSIRNKSYDLSDGTSGNMGERGCGPAAMAMVASQITGREIDPLTMANSATTNGYSIDAGTKPEYFQDMASNLGIGSENAAPTKENIKAMLSKGEPVILQGQSFQDGSPFTSEGHYVVGVGMNGDNVIVNDPRGRSYSGQYNIDELVSGAQGLWGFSNSGIQNTDDSVSNLFAANGPGVTGRSMNIGMPDRTKMSTADKLRKQVVEAIVSREGKNQYTQESPRTQVASGFGDCSSTVQWALKTGANIDPGGYSGAQYSNSLGIDVDNTAGGPDESKLLPGDLLFYKRSSSNFPDGVGHVEMYIGDGTRMGHGHDIGPYRSPLSKDGQSYLKARRFITDGASDFEYPKLMAASSASTQGTSSTYSDANLSSNQIEKSEEMTSESTEENKSILDVLLGAVSAATKPLIEWATGKKSTGTEEGRAFDPYNDSSLIDGTNSYDSSYSSGGSTAVGATSGLNYSRGGDYLGKYTAKFESGTGGPSTISSGSGDHGGVSFGTYQFKTDNAAQVASDSKLARFWNMYYASKYPGVVPGNNDAFKQAWTAEANADPKQFQANEVKFMTDNYYMPQVNKISGIINPDEYDRGLQEDIFATAVQFGEKTSVVYNALNGKDVKSMDPKDTINAIQDYKVANNASLFRSSDQNVRDGVKKRHDVTERGVLLDLAGKKPINPLKQYTQSDVGKKSLIGKSSEGTTMTNYAGAGGKGGNSGFIVKESTGSGLSEIASKSAQARETINNNDYNPMLSRMIELLGHIVDNTLGIKNGIKDLFDKDTPSPTQIIQGETHNNLIPVPQKAETDKDTSNYEAAKRISAGLYLG